MIRLTLISDDSDLYSAEAVEIKITDTSKLLAYDTDGALVKLKEMDIVHVFERYVTEEE